MNLRLTSIDVIINDYQHLNHVRISQSRYHVKIWVTDRRNCDAQRGELITAISDESRERSRESRCLPSARIWSGFDDRDRSIVGRPLRIPAFAIFPGPI